MAQSVEREEKGGSGAARRLDAARSDAPTCLPASGRGLEQGAALAAALCLFVLAASPTLSPPLAASPGESAPGGNPSARPAASGAPEADSGKVAAVDAAGLQAALASQKGKVVVLNFWATWCEPCREEFPDLVRFAGERSGRVALVTVSLDDPGMAGGPVRSFLDEMKAPGLRLIKGPGDPDAFINSVDPSWSGALPATFIHRPDGSRAHAVHGAIAYAKLSELVTPILPAE